MPTLKIDEPRQTTKLWTKTIRKLKMLSRLSGKTQVQIAEEFTEQALQEYKLAHPEQVAWIDSELASSTEETSAKE